LVLYYTMNDGLADGSNSNTTTLTDQSGSNNGTLQNFSLSGSSSNWTYGQNLSQTVYDTVVATACSQYMIPDSSGYWDETGTYDWTFTQGTGAVAGCDSIVTYDLTIDTVDTRTSANGIVLFALATNATYQWINCSDSSLITGATSATYVVTSNGDYAVKVTQGNCSEWSDCISISNIGLDEYTSSWAIYPNPAVDQFFIAHASSINDVALYDFNGRLLAILPVLEGWVQLPEQISTGVYIVRNVEFGLNTLLSVK